MSEVKARAAVTERLERAMRDRESRSKTKAYIFTSLVLVILATSAVLLYVFAGKTGTTKGQPTFEIAVGLMTGIWGAVVGVYVALKSKDDIYSKNTDDDLDVYRDLIIAQEQAMVARQELILQRHKFEAKIEELNKKLADSAMLQILNR